jgi:uncharacterized protein (TIGR02452 family)
VFRDHNYALLPAPYLASFLSCPAPNAGEIVRESPERLAQIRGVLAARLAMILAVAVHNHVGCLVLGAWGCGVFRNAPGEVAAAFKTHLTGDGQFASYFDHIVFAVYDRTPARSNLAAFRSGFRDWL